MPYRVDCFYDASPAILERILTKGRGNTEELGDGVEIFTADEFRELFGHAPELLPGEEGFFDQNRVSYFY